MKRKRGKARYYRNLEFQNDLTRVTWLNLEKSGCWFDEWHLHFDWSGYGNKSFTRRKPHLNKLFRHFNLLEVEAEKLEIDFQLYIIINDFDSYEDALFLHTPNANGSEFPKRLVGLSKTSTLTNRKLKGYLEECDGFQMMYGIANEPFCLLFKQGVGQPF